MAVKPKNFTVTKNNVPQLGKALKYLATHRVMIGIPADKANRKQDVDEGPINNAALMAIHEKGAPEVNIPARPVMEPTVKENQTLIRKGLGNAGQRALAGDLEGTDKALHALGITMQNKMRARIRATLEPPLAERTLAARRARGRTGTKPLWDTGQLLRALTYVIRVVSYFGRTIAGS